jgi:hypothetical protein
MSPDPTHDPIQANQAPAGKLRQLLQDLEVEIQSFETADPTQQQAIQHLKHDIDTLKAALGSPDPHPSTKGLKAFLEHLETQHPRLTLLLEQTIDTLAGMGI